MYTKMLNWGKWSGITPQVSETPSEYGKRLMDHFPGLGAEIELIVDAFNQEVYGLAPADRQKLSRLRSAQRRMKHLLNWPSRIRVWFTH